MKIPAPFAAFAILLAAVCLSAQAPLQQQIEALRGSNGTLHIQRGTHAVTHTLVTGGEKDEFSNTTISGEGIFGSTLSLAPGANTVILSDGPGHKSRFNITGVTFVGNKGQQQSPADCVHQGSESELDTNFYFTDATYSCARDGWVFGNVEARFSLNRMNIWNVFDVENARDGEDYPYGPQDVFSMGSLRNFNGRNGITIDNLATGNTEPCHFFSVGDHHESNHGFNWYVDHCFGFVRIGGFGLSDGYADAYLGPESARALWMGNRSTGSVDDLGFYNVVRDNHYQQFLTAPDLAGAGALRDKFPLLEDHMDASMAEDWDMSAQGASAWKASADAEVTKTNWTSAITGQQFLKLHCTTAPCEATQRIDAPAGVEGVWLRALYTGTDVGEYCGVQVRDGTGAVAWDSGWRRVASPGPYYRSEFAVEGTAAFSGQRVVALRNNSAKESCFFTDLRLVKNYAGDGSFEHTTQWKAVTGRWAADTAAVHTGAAAMRLTGDGARASLKSALPHGGYFLLKGWVRQNGAEPCRFGYGLAWDGTQTDRAYAFARAVEPTRIRGAWEGFSWVVRADSPAPISLGTFPGVPTDCSLDDVSLIRLNETPAMMQAVSPRLGGSSLAPGACQHVEVSMPGTDAGMEVPQPTPQTYPGDAFEWSGYIAGPGRVAVRICNRSQAEAAPAPAAYSVRVLR